MLYREIPSENGMTMDVQIISSPICGMICQFVGLTGV